MNPEQQPFIRVSDISHRFPNGRWGIKNVTVSLRQGELTVLTGRNGSGKTVLIRHLNGLLFPSSGEIYYRGKPIRKNLHLVRSKIGMVFQDPGHQIVGQTVKEDIEFGPENLRYSPQKIRKVVKKSMRLTGLEHLQDENPYHLSGGEKRRLAIAGVLAMDPDMIILDEPFTNLDYPGVRSVLEQIISLHKHGVTILIVTHELEKLLAHTDRLIIMDQGKIVSEGHPCQLWKLVGNYGLKPIPSVYTIKDMTWLK